MLSSRYIASSQQVYHGDTVTLFDLEADPKEERDLSSAATARRTLEAWRQRLVDRLSDRPEGFSKDGKLVAGCAYRPLNRGTRGG